MPLEDLRDHPNGVRFMVDVCTPLAEHVFDDEKVAIATVLTETADAFEHCGGDQPHHPVEALLDMEILTAMRYSAMGSGRHIHLPVNELDRLRSVAGTAALNEARHIVRRGRDRVR